MTIPNAVENLDRHWAVKVVTPEDRAAAIQYGMSVLTRLGAGEFTAGDAPPDFVVPLAGREMTVQYRHQLSGEAGLEAFHGLRRQRYLRNQD